MSYISLKYCSICPYTETRSPYMKAMKLFIASGSLTLVSKDVMAQFQKTEPKEKFVLIIPVLYSRITNRPWRQNALLSWRRLSPLITGIIVRYRGLLPDVQWDPYQCKYCKQVGIIGCREGYDMLLDCLLTVKPIVLRKLPTIYRRMGESAVTTS